MKNKNLLKDDLTGRYYSDCQFWKCNNKAFKKYAGIIHCRKHYRNHLTKTYGSLKNAKKYINKT